MAILLYDVRGQLLVAIKLLYKQSEVCVCVNGNETKHFGFSVGLRQDCVFSPLLLIIYMNKIDRDSFSSCGVTFRECNVWRLLFADDLDDLLSFNKRDFQYELDRFSGACLDVEMKLSTAKTEIRCFSGHPVECSFQTNGVISQKTETFKYLGVILSSDGGQDNELNTLIGKASSVMRQLYRLVVLR